MISNGTLIFRCQKNFTDITSFNIYFKNNKCIYFMWRHVPEIIASAIVNVNIKIATQYQKGKPQYLLIKL